MILAKNINIFDEYDFTESIVTNISWDSNLLDFLVTVDYYWATDSNEKELTIRFKNCREATLQMPKAFDSIPKDELPSYVYSWYTITNSNAIDENGVFKVTMKTVDENPRWLTVLCDEIWLEKVDSNQMKL